MRSSVFRSAAVLGRAKKNGTTSFLRDTHARTHARHCPPSTPRSSPPPHAQSEMTQGRNCPGSKFPVFDQTCPMLRGSENSSDEEATSRRWARSDAELGVHFIDGLIAVQRAPNGHVWYMPAYARACVRISRVYDWERLVRYLLRATQAGE